MSKLILVVFFLTLYLLVFISIDRALNKELRFDSEIIESYK